MLAIFIYIALLVATASGTRDFLAYTPCRVQPIVSELEAQYRLVVLLKQTKFHDLAHQLAGFSHESLGALRETDVCGLVDEFYDWYDELLASKGWEWKGRRFTRERPNHVTLIADFDVAPDTRAQPVERGYTYVNGKRRQWPLMWD